MKLLGYIPQLFKRKLSVLMIAFMLGVSNVIMEEERMVFDTRAQIEQQELQADDTNLDSELFKVVV